MKRARNRPKVEPCGCEQCARLDLEFPGEGRQLVLIISAKPVRKPRQKKAVRK